MTSTATVDDSAPSSALLRLSLVDMRQLFNSMDPAPFRERDLDPTAAAYIVDWAREAPTDQPLCVLVQLGRQSPTAGDDAMLGEAMHEYFSRRALASRRQLRRLFRDGRVSLLIGLAFLALAILVGELIVNLISQEGYARLVEESLVIGGWVALWRPLGIFLYDWWPIRAEARLFERLSVMAVSVRGPDPSTKGRS